MLSSRPYLARALYQWLLDNDQTPYIVVDAEHDGVVVPGQFVQNGQIVLNVAPSAVRDLLMENDGITFSARFSGRPMQVIVPSQALIALYARENGVGMVFGHEPVMPGFDPITQAEKEEINTPMPPSLSSVDSETPEEEASLEGEDKEAPRKKRPSLRIIK
ncbi:MULTISPECIES: ClpXP protease specificity-enhancing factor [Halomonadaceae]|uniref:ClpXP protease specificity-enhancing factor n=1 Tax=Halomonadaceae TaxID=28256 RepID=UPI00159724D0|nr:MULTISPECIES: ClpXP protease specificity-enhancing factor [Halomonas]QJQ97196.1 ClpXP protease specificity-enhancing factor [Halomonas sp. PA5]